MIIRWLLLVSLILLFCGRSVVAEPLASDKPWSRHCSTDGIPTRDVDEAKYLEDAAVRCEPVDACVLSCSRSGCAKGIAGECAHVCFRGLPEDLAKRADMWADRPSCRLPPNNSFKPNPHQVH